MSRLDRSLGGEINMPMIFLVQSDQKRITKRDRKKLKKVLFLKSQH
jgi:hypothetical protein